MDFPSEPPVDGTEAETLIGSLERQRATLAGKCGGLDAAAMRVTVGASSVTLGGLLKHLAHVEDWYFSTCLLGNDPTPPWDVHNWRDDPQWEWTPSDDDTPEALMALWRRFVDRSNANLAAVLADDGLDCLLKYTPWDERPSLRAVIAGLVEEYARHVGHADLIRESIDGLVGEDPPRPGRG